jgi:lipopolysaccharide/colanic/teichoic acid biosynthesis glycosyltransferase
MPPPRESRWEPLLPARSAASLRRHLFLKDCFDRVLALFMLVASAPLMLLSMALVKLTSRGPALYSQRRVGQFGLVFTIYKIRTMYHDCESLTGPRWSVPGDPHVTRIGRILRALHIDELPQLWNVLRGEMSLIGPRPERPEIAGKLEQSVELYDWRSAVKPGITGYAQVSLPPETTVAGVRPKIIMDRYYIRHQSLWLDLKILFWTAAKILGMTPKAQ